MRLTLSIMLVIASLATKSVAKDQQQTRPSIDVLNLNYRYRRAFSTLQAVDHSNFDYNLFSNTGERLLLAEVRNGKYDSRPSQPYGSDWVRLEWVQFVGSYAVVALSWVSTSGSSSDYGVVQVFALRHEHPVVVQQLMFNARGCGSRSTFDVAARKLTIKGVHGWEHCCPTTLDTVTYSWTGSSFTQQTVESIPIPSRC